MQDNHSNIHLQIVAERLTSLHADMTDMKDTVKESMKDVSQALTKLVQLEERDANRNASIERIFKQTEKYQDQVDKLTQRVVDLEIQAPANKQTFNWVSSVLYGLAGLAAMFIAKQVGLI